MITTKIVGIIPLTELLEARNVQVPPGYKVEKYYLNPQDEIEVTWVKDDDKLTEDYHKVLGKVVS